MVTPEYNVTTDYADFKSWLWFQEYLLLSEAAPLPKDAEVLSVSVGENFCTWVLNTPEVRDIVYRGYVLRNVEDDIEDSLLGLSTRYFLLRNGISEKNSTNLTSCWQVVKLILMGELPPPPHKDVRERLLRHSWAFKND